MAAKKKVPDFKSESDEAKWWESQGANLTRAFRKAARQGTLTRGTAKRKGSTPTTTIRLDPEDINLARNLAQRKGLRYQTYLKMLLRESLRKEEKKLVG